MQRHMWVTSISRIASVEHLPPRATPLTPYEGTRHSLEAYIFCNFFVLLSFGFPDFSGSGNATISVRDTHVAVVRDRWGKGGFKTVLQCAAVCGGLGGVQKYQSYASCSLYLPSPAEARTRASPGETPRAGPVAGLHPLEFHRVASDAAKVVISRPSERSMAQGLLVCAIGTAPLTVCCMPSPVLEGPKARAAPRFTIRTARSAPAAGLAEVLQVHAGQQAGEAQKRTGVAGDVETEGAVQQRPEERADDHAEGGRHVRHTVHHPIPTVASQLHQVRQEGHARGGDEPHPGPDEADAAEDGGEEGSHAHQAQP
mmetsp:Transcript_95387/g.164615  ORF Transcript_95387/g.164615 Transcript_95387/m.164615 type:complete len:313 (-) Transcript_95387:1135-2073(-)